MSTPGTQGSMSTSHEEQLIADVATHSSLKQPHRPLALTHNPLAKN